MGGVGFQKLPQALVLFIFFVYKHFGGFCRLWKNPESYQKSMPQWHPKYQKDDTRGLSSSHSRIGAAASGRRTTKGGRRAKARRSPL